MRDRAKLARPLLGALAALAASGLAAQPRVVVVDDVSRCAAWAAVALPDGRVVVAGNSDLDSWIAEILPSGLVGRQLRVSDRREVSIEAMAATADDGLVVTGSVYVGPQLFDLFIIRLDASWSVTWMKEYVRTTNALVDRIIDMPGGGWIMHGNRAFMRVAEDGTVLADTRYTTPNYSLNIGGVARLGADRWLVASRGQAAASTTLDVMTLMEVTNEGDVLSARMLDNPGQDRPSNVHGMSDGSAWISGTMYSADGATREAVVIRLRPDGSTRWIKGVVMPRAPNPGLSQLAPNGKLVVAGDMQVSPGASDIAIVELDDAGTPGAYGSFGGVDNDYVTGIARAPTGWLITGYTSSFLPGTSALVAVVDDSFSTGASCGLDVTRPVTVEDLFPVETPLVVTAVHLIGNVVSTSPVTLTPATLSFTEVCSSPQPPPREVSPAGTLVPLLVRDHGVLTWEDPAASGADAFDVYRGRIASLRTGDHGACWQTAITTTSIPDAASPGVANAWCYLVAGRNVVGRGPLGFDSFNVESAPSAPCP